MSSGGTLAARAATARQIKQAVVNLLFGKKYCKTGADEHRLLDHSKYSYDDLRKAYLDRLQLIHPDKANASAAQPHRDSAAEQMKVEFQQLHNAWEKYDELAKSMRIVTDGDGEAANFTFFGVGCSFSDSEQERALRTEITDQACRGWFTSGLLAERSSEKSGSSIDSGTRYSMGGTTSLADDSMFVQASDLDYDAKTSKSRRQSHAVAFISKRPRNRTLIPGYKD